MPDPKQEHERLRGERTTIDQELLKLLARRADLSRRIGVLRRDLKDALPAETMGDVLGRVEQALGGQATALPIEAARVVFREIVSACQQLEAPLRVVYAGPEGGDGHQACRRAFGQGAIAVSAESAAAVFEEVERGRAALGIVPVELSTEGIISSTLDRLVESALKITGEIEQPVAHHVMNRTGNLADVEKIYAHAPVLALCRRWIDAHLGDKPVIDVRSTTQAAQFAVDDHGAACIAGDLVGELYDLEIAQAAIDDDLDARIRFLVVGMTEARPTGRDQTSLVFALKDHPGALYEALKPLADRKINLTRIESRPSQNPLWDYVFFVDLDGHVTERSVTSAVEEVKRSTKFVRVLGSYPKR